jgi:hypothetical protein
MLIHDRTHTPFSRKEKAQTGERAHLCHRPLTALLPYEAPTLPLFIDYMLLLITPVANVLTRLDCCVLADDICPLSCDDQLLLGKHIGKDIFHPLPELEALVSIQNQGLHECLGLLTTRFPNGFDGQAPFCQ